MTTGSKDSSSVTAYRDTRHSWDSWYGLRKTKTWSGGDRPAGVVTNGWHPYTMTLIQHSAAVARYHLYAPPSIDVWLQGSCLYTYSVNHPPPINESDLVGKLANLVKGHSFNALIALGEGRESLDTVLLGVKRIAASLLALRRGNLFSALNELGVTRRTGSKIPESGIYFEVSHGIFSIKKRGLPRRQVRNGILNGSRISISDTWLDLQYGWGPILSDIFEAMKSFYKRSNAPRVDYYRTSISSTGSVVVEGSTQASETYAKRRCIITFRQTEKMSLAAELGLTDPASLVWELLPFSFLADWFIPIGSYLQARSFTTSAVGEYAVSELESWGLTLDPSTCTETYYVSGGDETVKVFTYSRSAFVAISRLDLKPPGFKPWVKSLTLGHALNAIALIGSVATKGRSVGIV